MIDEELYEIARKAYSESNKDYITNQVQQACKYCPNNPQNGGSGICYCILGASVTY